MSDDKVHVHWHEHSVTREEREALNKHQGCVVWFTGLSACGKSTISNLVDHKLHATTTIFLRVSALATMCGMGSTPGRECSKNGMRKNSQNVLDWVSRLKTVRKTFAASGPWQNCFAQPE